MPARYQALGPHQFDFELAQVPKTTPEGGEVVVRVKAIALNPLDWKMVAYNLMVPKWPTVLGAEAAGVVDAVGAGATKFKVGDEVFGLFTPANDRQGSYQEYAAAKEGMLLSKPTSVTAEDAASLPIGFLTAMAAIHVGLGIPVDSLVPGTEKSGNHPKTILVLGGSSAVGASAIQILRKLDVSTTILTTCSEKNHARATAFGATAAFSQTSPSLLDDIRSASAEGSGVEAILDAVGGLAGKAELLDLLTGPKLLESVPGGPPLAAQVGGEEKLKGLKAKEVGGYDILAVPGGFNVFQALQDLLAEGKWELPVQVEVFGKGLEALKPALLRLKDGVSATKVIVTL